MTIISQVILIVMIGRDYRDSAAGSEQDELASKYPDNPLLKYRGNAGTHDINLAVSNLRSLLGQDPCRPVVVHVPRYDKSLRQGRGDRVPRDSWTRVNVSNVDIILFEGWMLGFTPLTDTSSIPKEILEINEKLKNYRDVHELMDSWLVLSVEDINVVYEWRLEAERMMRAQGRPSMTDDQVRDFVARFMPAYRAFLPRLYTLGPQRRPHSPLITALMDKHRSASFIHSRL